MQALFPYGIVAVVSRAQKSSSTTTTAATTATTSEAAIVKERREQLLVKTANVARRCTKRKQKMPIQRRAAGETIQKQK